MTKMMETKSVSNNNNNNSDDNGDDDDDDQEWQYGKATILTDNNADWQNS